MKAKDVMRTTYECTSPEKGIASIENRLLKYQFLVVKDDDRFKGIITANDIVKFPYQLVEDCLSPKIHVDCADSIESVLSKMRGTGNFVLPLFEDGNFVGIIVESDIIKYLMLYRDKLEKTIVENNNDLSNINALLSLESETLKAVQEANERTMVLLRLITNNMSDMIALTDIKGNFQYYSPSHKVFTGYNYEVMLGKSFFDFVHPEDVEKVKLDFENTVATSTLIRTEYRIRHADGHYVWVEAINDFMDDEVSKIKGVVLAYRDITIHKLAEDALRKSEEEKDVVLNNILEPVFHIDTNMKILSTNKASYELINLPLDQVEGKICYEVFHNRNKPCGVCPIIKAFETGKPHETDVISSFGKKWILRAYPVHDEGGNVTSAIEIAYDITAIKQAEEEKANLEARLHRAEEMEAIGTLAGGVAHDLNNVLGGIVGYPELLLMQLPEDSPLRKPLSIIRKSGERAAAIVQDLQTLTRSGFTSTEVVDLNRIISDHMKTPEFEKIRSIHPHMRFEIDLEEKLLNISGSPVHLSKTIMNLISNAAEAMPHGGKVLISTGNRYIDRPVVGYDEIAEGEYVTLSISDEGTGMSKEVADRIFEPFYTKKVMGRSGTGLGMTVVWGVVNDHKGYIDIRSTEEKGTTVTLYFPATRKELIKADAPLSVEEYMGKGESILIVDDVETQREIATGMLERLGYKVTSVSSGEGAIEYLKGNSADLLLLDMIMDPGIDGLETYKRILETHPKQKALIVSGYAETERVKEAQKLGAGAYIKKPFVFEQIGIAVRYELDE